MPPLYEYTWNHTTLHALTRRAGHHLSADPLSGGRRGRAASRRSSGRFGDELLLHLEIQRRFGRVFVSACRCLRYRSPERLAEVVATIEAMGGAVSNPHTYVLDNAGWKRTDAPQAEFKASPTRTA